MKSLYSFCFIAGTSMWFSKAQVTDAENVPSLNESTQGQDIVFTPGDLYKMRMGNSSLLQWKTFVPGVRHVIINMENSDIAKIIHFEEELGSEISSNSNIPTAQGTLNVTAVFIGYTSINITLMDSRNQTIGVGELRISVLLSYQKVNDTFIYILGFFLFIVYVHMGATIDLEVVKQIVKRPIGPVIGICCQYIFMPLSAFGLAKGLFPGNSLMQLGLFLNGASPGGGASNMWTYLLGGSLDLSIMMTFASTVVAFGSVPMWVFLLGPLIVGDDADFQIPYLRIFILVVMLVIPCTIGVLIQFKLPKVAKVMQRSLAYVSLGNLIFVFTFGIYANRYVFSYFSYKTFLAGLGLPGLGYVVGLLVSTLFRRPKKDIIAISIETGIQNANITIFILKLTLEAPSGDLAVVIPASTVIMTPVPLMSILIIKKLYERFRKSGQTEISKDVKQMATAGVDNPALVFDEVKSSEEVLSTVAKGGEERGSSTAADNVLKRGEARGIRNGVALSDNQDKTYITNRHEDR